jgi:hypothetical protein
MDNQKQTEERLSDIKELIENNDKKNKVRKIQFCDIA